MLSLFSSDINIDKCVPELVERLRHVTCSDDMESVENDYHPVDVVDAIFAIAQEEDAKEEDLDYKAYEIWLQDSFFDWYYKDVRNALLQHNAAKRENFVKLD